MILLEDHPLKNVTSDESLRLSYVYIGQNINSTFFHKNQNWTHPHNPPLPPKKMKTLQNAQTTKKYLLSNIFLINCKKLAPI